MWILTSTHERLYCWGVFIIVRTFDISASFFRGPLVQIILRVGGCADLVRLGKVSAVPWTFSTTAAKHSGNCTCHQFWRSENFRSWSQGAFKNFALFWHETENTRVSQLKTFNIFYLVIFWTQKVHNDFIFLCSIVLPPVGHSSNHEYHCWNLQDSRAVVRIFIALLSFSFRPASWSSGQSLLLIMRSRVRFPVLPWEFSLKGKIPAVTMDWVG